MPEQMMTGTSATSRFNLSRMSCSEPVARSLLVAFALLLWSVAHGAVAKEGVRAVTAEKVICVGHHELRLPAGANAKISATYVGLSVSDEGPADWETVAALLRSRARKAELSPSPRDAFAEKLYRAAGMDPSDAFADSSLVGFDLSGQQAIIAVHVNQSSAFVVEAHRLYDGRHFVFGGKHNLASNYLSVRDGVWRTVARFTPLAEDEVPRSHGFCTGNGVFALKDRHDIGGDAQLYVTFPAYPGLKFSLSLYGLVEQNKKPSFIERAGRSLLERGVLGGNVRTLHRGSRKYAGQRGRLVAVSMASEDGGDGRAYKYFWHARGEAQDPFLPEIEAELMTDTAGSAVDAKTVEALWLQIMGSLRARGP